MGWDKLTKHFNSRSEIKQYFDDYFQIGNPQNSAIVGNVYYAATNKSWDKSGLLSVKNKVFCWVVLFTYSETEPSFNFGYKVMDSSMHPYNYDVPERIFKLLSEPVTASEKEWFAGVKKYQENKAKAKNVKPGTVVKFKEPLKFKHNKVFDTFVYVEKSIFKTETVLGTNLYRIPKWQQREFEIL